MICYALQLIHRDFPLAKLASGSMIAEPRVRPECQLSPWSLNVIHQGKDASIDHMLQGGNGFPARCFPDYEYENIFDMGCQQEQLDFRALNSTRSY